jgi:AcrR family transcriptional regulator
VPARAMRADARRNYEQLVAAAMAVVAEEGPDASLNEVAKRAGVGAGTLYRHFPTRESLLAAVYEGRLARLCARAEEAGGALPPAEALVDWLRALVTHAMTDRGLGARMMLSPEAAGVDCWATLHAAAERLLRPAQEAGAVRADVEAADLIALAGGIAQATPDPAHATHLLTLTLTGLLTPTP